MDSTISLSPIVVESVTPSVSYSLQEQTLLTSYTKWISGSLVTTVTQTHVFESLTLEQEKSQTFVSFIPTSIVSPTVTPSFTFGENDDVATGSRKQDHAGEPQSTRNPTITGSPNQAQNKDPDQPWTKDDKNGDWLIHSGAGSLRSSFSLTIILGALPWAVMALI
jgi:hypothetical protein